MYHKAIDLLPVRVYRLAQSNEGRRSSMSIHTDTIITTAIKQAIDSFLLSCKVEGKSWGTIDCYADKLKGFLWYATNYDWPNDTSEITT